MEKLLTPPPEGYAILPNWLIWTVLVGAFAGFSALGIMIRAMWIKGMDQSATNVTTLIGLVKEVTASNADLSKSMALVLTKMDELLRRD